MTALYDKLTRILLLEQEQGFTDRAVIGGLSRFLGYWREQAAESGSDGQVAPAADAILRGLEGYARMAPDERRRAITQALARARDANTAAPRAERPAAASSRPDGPAEGTPARHRISESPPPAPDARRPRPASRSAPPKRSTARKGEELTLESPVTAIKGVSNVYQERLARLGLHTIKDLIYHFPRRYDDYSRLQTVNRLRLGDEVTVVGTVRSAKTWRARSGQRGVSVSLSDGTGVVEARFFGPWYMAQRFRAGNEVVLSGRVDQYLGRLVLNNPEWEPLQRELLHTGRLVPVYALTRGIGARRMRGLIKDTLDYWTPRIVDPLPAAIREEQGLMGLGKALEQIHFPESTEALQEARRRLCFDEFLLLQLGVLGQRSLWREQEGLPLDASRLDLDAFVASLPFALTGAQERVIRDILADLERPTPMRRLLQGDVGSGKTVVAVAALLAAVRNGYQAAVMAPTGLLAEQHDRTIRALLEPFSDVRCALLTGSLPAPEKARIHDQAEAGEIDVLIGTHALIQDTVSMPRLGLVVVDEQHRFGVTQRAALAERGAARPHVLAMSATPIPRSLAMTVYGDLDVSVLDEMPAGRQPIITAVRDDSNRERIYAFVNAQVEQGCQAFVVCPLIEESDEVPGKAAVSEHRRLQETIFRHLRLGLVHGRMSADEKDEVMAAFRRREMDILVSTSVIEVGIDIPNATVMLVESAGRFGLAQLHQLRGRVGRGDERSYCILLSDDSSVAALERLRIMENTADGFALAEEDLRMRGPGDFFGVRQHGLPSLKVAQLSDTAVLEQARGAALRLFEEDPDLGREEHRNLALSVRHFWASAESAS
ncbi:MAG: ATP-dependent DNA helicase RecG [Chloroflexi bacterium]|nr:ATP-dependent DNA helicase RecG [Chloroflexota bacterium]